MRELERLIEDCVLNFHARYRITHQRVNEYPESQERASMIAVWVFTMQANALGEGADEEFFYEVVYRVLRRLASSSRIPSYMDDAVEFHAETRAKYGPPKEDAPGYYLRMRK